MTLYERLASNRLHIVASSLDIKSEDVMNE